MKQKKARPAVGAARRATESRTAYKTARPSTNNFITMSARRQRPIANLLLHGQKNAVYWRHLTTLTNSLTGYRHWRSRQQQILSNIWHGGD